MPQLGQKIYQYDLDGNYVNEFPSLLAAQDITKINNLSLVINNKKNSCSAGGYIWTKKYYIKLPQDIIDKYDNRLFERYNVPIYEYDLNGNLINEYSSLCKVSKIRKERNNVRSALKNEIKTFKNKIYKFEKFKKLPKKILEYHTNKWAGKIVQYDLNGKKIKEWSSCYEAATTLKISRTNINRSLYGERKISNGFIWKYKEQATDEHV